MHNMYNIFYNGHCKMHVYTICFMIAIMKYIRNIIYFITAVAKHIVYTICFMTAIVKCIVFFLYVAIAPNIL
jgi:hypothetical protein